uniref:Uncharacterized protein n=1 Tax=viral metagenome TaxID=1070528 RepID=A0A6C0JEJ1_9ZZZZ
MLLGGGLNSNKAFKKIISIGYEFETNGISKLSLHQNKKTLINSDLALRTLQDKIDRKSAKIIDDNYISVGIPIGVDLKKLQDESENKTNDEEIVLTEEEQEEREYWEEFYRKEKLASKYSKIENDNYMDYFFENRKTDNKKVIKFQVTNDLGKSDFETMIKNLCQNLTIPKNDMFFFKTKSGKVLDFKFAEDIASNEYCESFSNVEFVVTYFSPKKDNPNLIVETFVDACSRVVDHLANLQKTTGKLLISNDGKTDLTTIGNIMDKRCLYHKPNTNLFYMDIYDDEDTVKPQNLRDIYFIPQMTFKSKAHDTLEIMKQILEYDEEYNVSQTLIFNMEIEYNIFAYVEEIVDDLINNFNQQSPKAIDIDTDMGKTIKLYMFLIYYKLYQFVDNHIPILSKKRYLKDYLTFASRHSNYVLYFRVKDILEDHYGIIDVDIVKSLFYDSVIMEKVYEKDDEEEEEDFDEDGNYKYDYDAFEKDLGETDANFGNPLFSMSSYFDHFEIKKSDWFKEAKLDVFSTGFDLTSDEVLLENRYFAPEIILYLQNAVDPKISKSSESTKNKILTLHELDKVVAKLYGDNVKNMMNLERNPTNKKLTLKCKPGHFHDLNFDCVPTKKTKTLRRMSRMSKNRKTLRSLNSVKVVKP